MPELPEVETIRQDLRKKILNKKIIRVAVFKSQSVGGENKKFVRALVGNSFREIDRRGKLMIFRLKDVGIDSNQSLLVHLKMTGQLIYVKELKKRAGSGYPLLSKEGGGVVAEVVAGGHKMTESDIECLPNKHTRVAFIFADGGRLFFNDLRRFGYMKLAGETEVEKALKKFGPEPPLTLPSPAGRGGSRLPLLGGEGYRVRSGRSLGDQLTFEYFSGLFKKASRTKLKAILLDQTKIAGIGNIYADEICFCAKVKQTRSASSLTLGEKKALYRCTSTTIRAAIKHRGTTFRNFLDSSGRKGNYTDFLNVYDRDGQRCKRCKSVIKKIKAAGRGTHYCPKCQK